MSIDRAALAARLEASTITHENRDERLQEIREAQAARKPVAESVQTEIKLDDGEPGDAVSRETGEDPKPLDAKKPDDKPSDERDKTSDFQRIRREAREAKERADRVERENRELRARLNPPTPDNPAPKLADFNGDAEKYADAKAEWKVAEQRRQDEQAEQQRRIADRTSELRKEYEDFDETLKSGADVEVKPLALKALLDCGENIPDLQYYLIKNPEEMERINGFTELGAARAYGAILRDLELKRDRAAAKASRDEDEPAARVTTLRSVSQAPRPITPLKGAKSAPSASIDGNGEFTGSFKDYKAQRRAGLIK